MCSGFNAPNGKGPVGDSMPTKEEKRMAERKTTGEGKFVEKLEKIGGRDPGEVPTHCQACGRLFGKDDVRIKRVKGIKKRVCPICYAKWPLFEGSSTSSLGNTTSQKSTE